MRDNYQYDWLGTDYVNSSSTFCCKGVIARDLGTDYPTPRCFATLAFKMADGAILLGLVDEIMSENDDKICGWTTNKIGGTPVSKLGLLDD